MDPQATLEALDAALLAEGGDALVEELLDSLVEWLDKGGYHPQWVEFPRAREAFVARCETHGTDIDLDPLYCTRFPYDEPLVRVDMGNGYSDVWRRPDAQACWEDGTLVRLHELEAEMEPEDVKRYLLACGRAGLRVDCSTKSSAERMAR